MIVDFATRIKNSIKSVDWANIDDKRTDKILEANYNRVNNVDNMASLTPKECNRFHEVFDPLCTTYDTYVIKHSSSPLIDMELIRTIITYAIRYNQSIDIHIEDGNLCEYTITLCGMCLMSAYANWVSNGSEYCINNM